MVDTQALIGRIAALRKRLEQTPELSAKTAPKASMAAVVHAGGEHDELVDASLAPATAPVAPSLPLPRQLTARARDILERGRVLLDRLRSVSDAFAPFLAPTDGDAVDDPIAAADLIAKNEPLALLYRETASMTDTALRMIPLFPDSAAAQMRLCDGLEGTLSVIARRVETLRAGVDLRRAEAGRVTQLTALLTAVAHGEAAALSDFAPLVAEIIAEVEEGTPLRFPGFDSHSAHRAVAVHSLTVARVVARVVRHDAELRGRLNEAVLAALVHDVGMLLLEPPLLAHAGPLDDKARRTVEAHCRLGAERLRQIAPKESVYADVAATHHERLDGAGYPDGLSGPHLSTLSRLIAVCDVYAALASSRPSRPARESRTALTETLLMADQGLLDSSHAERLLHLSFYPVGSAVEFAEGPVGVVVATPSGRRESFNPARPVVAVLTDARGEPLPLPRHLDLARSDSHSIVRTLTETERRELLGRRFPEWA
jgi:HD-GYP domain-containing protein (c-di-GMP phosphodiesterase class II)